MRAMRDDAKNIRSLLGRARYSIDYYKRDYYWARKQIAEQVWSPENLLWEVGS